MNIASWLHATAHARPSAPAIFSGERLHADYATFARRSAAIAEGLRARHGIAAGDRVVIFLKNCPEYLELLYGIWWLGAVAVPANAKLHPAEIAYIAEDSGARLLVSDTGNLRSESELPANCTEIALGSAAWEELQTLGGPEKPAETDAHDTAWIFYTSGTTGRPKGVMLTHRNLMMMSLCYAIDVDQVAHDHTILYPAPMSHGGGLYNFPYVRAGARHCVPVSRGFDAGEIAALSRHFGETAYFAAPTMVRRQIDEAQRSGYRGEGIRTIVYGGGPMYGPDIDEALDLFGPRFVQIYGQGESPMTISVLARELVADTAHPNWRKRRDSVGIAQACIELRIVDGHGKDLPSGQSGEILVRGDTVMRGYWRNEEATAKTIVDGWLHTGDIGHLDEDGFLTLTDRSKDVIISGGTNIYPREVEDVLISHPAVAEAAVIGLPDPEWGEIVVAVIAARGDAVLREDELEALCRSRIASFKKPRRYVFLAELPKNAYGKILKRELREQLSQK